jgi:tripartite-type tricarboxylate transporter receptor subunit TctC
MVSDREGGRSEGGVIGLKTLSLLLALIAALGCMADAHAQSFPSRPVTIVVPYGPGGPADILARIMAERMRGPLGQPVVVENVAGAAGTMGVSRVVRAAPDGYTLSYGNWGTHVLNGVIQKVNYDVLTDLDPIALLPDNPYIAVTNAAVPVNDFREMMAWLKANPNTASQGTGGSGSGSHVIGIYFQSLTGTQYQFVPYRQGTAGQTQDILSGQIQMMFDQPSNAVPHVRSGRIKAHAVLAKDRLAMAPEIPTVDEAGLPGFHVSTWYGLWAPKGTPQDIVARLNAAAVEALADPAVAQRLTGMGFAITSRDQQTPEALAAHHKAEIAKWSAIVKAAGVKAE